MFGRSQAGLVIVNWNCKVEVRRISGLNTIAIIREPKSLVTGCSRLHLILFNVLIWHITITWHVCELNYIV